MADEYEQGRLAQERLRREQDDKREAARQQEAARARRELLGGLCTNCQAANSRVKGTLCYGCWQAQNTEVASAETTGYGTTESSDLTAWLIDQTEIDMQQDMERERREWLQGICTNCQATNSRVIGTLCYGCWQAQNPGDKFPEPNADAPPRAWELYLAQLPTQVHHLASDKATSGEWTLMAREIADLYDLRLSEAWNLVKLHHEGTHPPEYHAYVVGTMQYAMDEARGDTQEFLRIYKELVTDVVTQYPQMLRWNAWDR